MNSSISRNSVQHVRSLVLFDQSIGPNQVLSLRIRMELEAMAMREYSAFPKAPALLKPHHQIV